MTGYLLIAARLKLMTVAWRSRLKMPPLQEAFMDTESPTASFLAAATSADWKSKMA
jgi:hypothetical protein